MIVLGINDGHNASAALIINGKLTCAIAEERLSRKKNHFGYPEQSIKCVLDYSGVTIKDVNKIALSSKHFMPAYYYVSRNSGITIQDYWKEQNEYWYPKL